jgi:dipeptidyl aminopeptidase/acylaminoacyl peptidase
MLFVSSPFRSDPSRPATLATQSVQFRAGDGTVLHGWLVVTRPTRPTIVLVSGFKEDRKPMVPYARMLSGAGFNVLLYDSRGTGGSSGTFGLGLREVGDVRGAVAYLQHCRDLHDHHYGLLGVSLGAGVVIVAASQERAVRATVADSAYTDQEAVVTRLNSLRFRRLSFPLAPLGPWTADLLLGAHLSSFSPLRSIRQIAPRHVLLIHSLHDANITTPLSGAYALKRAGGPAINLWVAPKGGHAGAFAAQPKAYRARVVPFFRRYLG